MAGPTDGEGAWPTGPGGYLLVLHLARAQTLTVGRLGVFALTAGYYFYAGSALGGLRGRVLRHLRASKRRHWHIDYLAQVAEVAAVGAVRSSERLECRWAQRLAALDGYTRWPPRFGASDCGCAGHLLHAPEPPALEEIMALLSDGAPWLVQRLG